jgi:hypothetical protein
VALHTRIPPGGRTIGQLVGCSTETASPHRHDQQSNSGLTFMEGRIFLDYLRDYQLLTKDTGSHS